MSLELNVRFSGCDRVQPVFSDGEIVEIAAEIDAQLLELRSLFGTVLLSRQIHSSSRVMRTRSTHSRVFLDVLGIQAFFSEEFS
jgi:hypothetical protein